MKNKVISFNDIISLQNIHEAWQEFVRGKKNKKDVAEFCLNLSRNIQNLHKDLKDKTYKHGGYHAFNISDPKPRNIHKATVRDRLLHHAIYRVLYPYFDTKFIYDSYSCRLGKGTHRAVNRFRDFTRKVSKNNTRTCWVLKCDIRKFFASIDHIILIQTLKKHILDNDIIWLLERVIESFYSTETGKGLPLGNLTSQLLVNIYMNEFDQYVKHILKERYYIRYADDFVFFNTDKTHFEKILAEISVFLEAKLKLKLHPNKVFIKTIASGVDFIGWVNFPNHRVLRTVTKRRMFKKVKAKNNKPETIPSYLGLLKHGNTFKIQKQIIQRTLR